ncbi:MAG: ISKra4 family transposase [Cyanobacteria bacterium J06560_2]
MDATTAEQIRLHARAIAKLLYQETEATAPQSLETFSGIEVAVRDHLLEYIGPEIGEFFVKSASERKSGRSRTLKSIIGDIEITTASARELGVQAHSRLSPILTNCCLLLSANESYERAEEDIRVLTGRSVSHSTQQRLVHRQAIGLTPATKTVEELSVDGGRIRVRTPKGKACEWRDYKAVKLHEQSIGASYKDNKVLIDWVNQQPLASRLVCLGDGHDGVWNLIAEIGDETQRREILDWYHLMENWAKLESRSDTMYEVQDLLWEGMLKPAIAQLEQSSEARAPTFIAYLRKHQKRIVDYEYLQFTGVSIGSGAVESGIKQIANRVKLTGAQWKVENVPQVLRQRCAYLNGEFSTVD